jgi:hypothetical protein
MRISLFTGGSGSENIQTGLHLLNSNIELFAAKESIFWLRQILLISNNAFGTYLENFIFGDYINAKNAYEYYWFH